MTKNELIEDINKLPPQSISNKFQADLQDINTKIANQKINPKSLLAAIIKISNEIEVIIFDKKEGDINNSMFSVIYKYPIQNARITSDETRYLNNEHSKIMRLVKDAGIKRLSPYLTWKMQPYSAQELKKNLTPKITSFLEENKNSPLYDILHFEKSIFIEYQNAAGKIDEHEIKNLTMVNDRVMNIVRDIITNAGRTFSDRPAPKVQDKKEDTYIRVILAPEIKNFLKHERPKAIHDIVAGKSHSVIITFTTKGDADKEKTFLLNSEAALSGNNLVDTTSSNYKILAGKSIGLIIEQVTHILADFHQLPITKRPENIIPADISPFLPGASIEAKASVTAQPEKTASSTPPDKKTLKVDVPIKLLANLNELEDMIFRMKQDKPQAKEYSVQEGTSQSGGPHGSTYLHILIKDVVKDEILSHSNIIVKNIDLRETKNKCKEIMRSMKENTTIGIPDARKKR